MCLLAEQKGMSLDSQHVWLCGHNPSTWGRAETSWSLELAGQPVRTTGKHWVWRDLISKDKVKMMEEDTHHRSLASTYMHSFAHTQQTHRNMAYLFCLIILKQDFPGSSPGSTMYYLDSSGKSFYLHALISSLVQCSEWPGSLRQLLGLH